MLPVTGDIPNVRLLEKEQTDYRLQWNTQVLRDAESGYTFAEILDPAQQSKFQPYLDYTDAIQNHQYYWGKLQIENRLTDADRYTEWVLSFTNNWSNLEVFTIDNNGAWQQERSGAFTPNGIKKFVPTARGNLIKLKLPPQEVVTIYFRGISERTAIYPSFYTRLKHIETFYNDLLKTKVGNAFFIGFILMMFFYNLMLYFYERDSSFFFYSCYLIMLVIYSTYSSDDLVDWFGLFPDNPEQERFMKLSLYLSMMCYLTFIRSFLDLKHLLPKWDKVFKWVIYLGFPLIFLDVIILLATNFSYVVEDKIVVPYIVLMLIVCIGLLYPLYKTKDKKGYFIIAGISAIVVGAIITVLVRVWFPPFTIFYLKAGTVVEVLIFSLGLAYRQKHQQKARQQADFKLKESQLIQEKNQIEAKRLKELNDFKTRFYTNITHEFRTPLTLIMGISEHIKQHEEEKKLIQRNSQNLLRLINQLLDLSKLESRSLTLHKVHQDIIAYLRYLTESFYSTATHKNIRFLFHSEEETVKMDYDEERIQEIVYNLLSNALKFTKDYGQIIFHASTIDRDGQPHLKLKIKDNGIGISPEELPLIFDRFYQSEQQEMNRVGSTGIGLALTKELVELMNGHIEVQSQVGEGTQFLLYLPIEANVKSTTPTWLNAQNDSQKKEQPASSKTNRMHPTKVEMEELEETEAMHFTTLPELLMIEDNPDIIKYIKTILKTSYNIHSALNGNIGVEKALQIIPDIIISDVMMPEKNGYEVCETLKQDERTSHIPIILLTAKATQEDKLEGLKYGADAYLIKPFDKKELLIQLENLVKLRQRLQLRYSNPSIEPTSESSMEDLFLQKLQSSIQTRINDTEFGVAELASTAYLSQMQLYRKLKALTGKTPSLFIRSYRLQQGLELLKKGHLNISEIAYEVGFTDPSYFSRVFQKEFGTSPSDYIK